MRLRCCIHQAAQERTAVNWSARRVQQGHFGRVDHHFDAFGAGVGVQAHFVFLCCGAGVRGLGFGLGLGSGVGFKSALLRLVEYVRTRELEELELRLRDAIRAPGGDGGRLDIAQACNCRSPAETVDDGVWVFGIHATF